jgi:hypothetical protein
MFKVGLRDFINGKQNAAWVWLKDGSFSVIYITALTEIGGLVTCVRTLNSVKIC